MAQSQKTKPDPATPAFRFHNSSFPLMPHFILHAFPVLHSFSEGGSLQPFFWPFCRLWRKLSSTTKKQMQTLSLGKTGVGRNLAAFPSSH